MSKLVKIIVIGFSFSMLFGCSAKKEEPVVKEALTIVEEQQTAEKPEEVIHKIEGEILHVSMNTVEIETDGDKEHLVFTTTHAEHHYKNGMKVGNHSVVKYKGEINGTDTSKALVAAIYDDEANLEHEDAKEAEHTISGVVLNATMSNTQVQLEDGTILEFATGDAEHYYKNGIQIGNSITLTYTGEIKGTDTSDTVVIFVKDNVANTGARSIIGLVDTETTMNNLTLDVAGGYMLDFSIADATITCEGGIMEGAVVKVTYQGIVDPTGTQPVVAITVEDAE